MSIKIHHGPNGSYKTSGALQDDAIPALKEGRVIITNVRGFTLERAYTVFPELPDTSEIINLSLESLPDLERMRTWFQWAPRGAFIIFDETQLVFPKSWRDSDLKRFDFPGGPEAAAEADRPMGWLDAWTRHRHFNWDIVLTTPNIAYIRDDIRMTCEMAYRHSNLAVIGIPGRYKEAQHDAQINRPPMDGTVIEYKRIRKQTFTLYDSTATGTHHDTKAGKSLLRSPKLLVLLAFIAACLSFSAWMGPVTFGVASPDETAAEPAQTGGPHYPQDTGPPGALAAAPSDPANSILPGLPVGLQPDGPPAQLAHPFGDRTISIIGTLHMPTKGVIYLFQMTDSDGRVMELNSWQLIASGYRFKPQGECVVRVTYEDWDSRFTCLGQPRNNAPTVPALATPPSPPTNPYAAPGTVRVTVVNDSSRSPRTLQ
ncbi:zonular occludens toxin domain-containing protein [Pseudomonas sp. PDM13]|uniref:zonular occludens toxin domain-containing protein n=1 Tax=Pseudomonas sp. PDM13 TaxID=2769255 RepID=UPI0021DF8D6E|nr:zonular occludens toxin domain-containing protein [Pseudomonas sp. PDM13]MCU9947893.1 hypothetical protein [Pseudomonas sp. PDM13]